MILPARLLRAGLANGTAHQTIGIKNGTHGPASRFQLGKLVRLLFTNAKRNETTGAALPEQGDPFGADAALRTTLITSLTCSQWRAFKPLLIFKIQLFAFPMSSRDKGGSHVFHSAIGTAI